MKTLMAGVLGAALLGGGSLLASGERTDPSRPDCPGQIQCPQTGEWVCKDRCPEQQKEQPPRWERCL